jgi:methylated-DNA-protein-cysteine methyltransferase-like protein
MSVFEKVYEIIIQIPRGHVLTYAKISEMMGRRLSAQAVGWALKALPDDETKSKNGSAYHAKNVPWHRVINSRGTISTNSGLDIPPGLQRRLLEAEGIVFGTDDALDLEKYLWSPKRERPRKDGPKGSVPKEKGDKM